MSELTGLFIKKIGNHRGAPRVWLEGSQASNAGFLPGQRYDVQVEGQKVVLQANADGSRVVSSKVSGERVNPVIDLNSKSLLAVFDGMDAVRVVVKEGQIFLLPLASELKKQERFTRLRARLETGTPLSTASLSFGGGILTHALHAGLAAGGVLSNLAFANEIREELLEHAKVHNDAWAPSTIPLAAPMQELAFDERAMSHLPKIDVLEMGLPCSGASPAGKSKRALSHPEDHPEVGHLVVGALMILAKANPSIVVLENVPQYAKSASASILRTQLRDLGYRTHETTLNGKQWGSLEDRTRWCMVAVSEGIPFSFDQLQPGPVPVVRVKDILDPVPLDHPSYKDRQGLKDKMERDKAAGKGFMMQFVSEDDLRVGTLTKGYMKDRSTDPKLLHPTDSELSRLFTPAEHARVKGVPERLIAGLSATTAHGVVGQSVSYPCFVGVGKHLAATLRDWDGRPIPKPARLPEGILELAGEVVATLTLASPQGLYKGQIVAAHQGSFIQDIGEGQGVLHTSSDFKNPPAIGQRSLLEYDGGVGKSRDLAPAREQGLAC